LNLAPLSHPAAPGLLDAPLKAGHDNREVGDCALRSSQPYFASEVIVVDVDHSARVQGRHLMAAVAARV